VNLILVGTNHKYSPVEFRERIAFSKKRVRDEISFLKENTGLNGAIIISTCNRTEIYASTDNKDKGLWELEDFISRYHQIDKESISPYLYRYADEGALKHLFSVASGTDSLILGETQVLGQVRASFLKSQSIGFTDKLLDGVFNSAFFFAKDMHATTKISEGKVSVGSVAIDFIKKKIGRLENKIILIIGVGKVTELVLKYLEKERASVVFVSNRTFSRAREFASQIGAQAVRFDNLRESLGKADIVITATASPHFIIKKETFKEKQNGKLLIIDLALPRDVDPEVKRIENVDLFGLEDLDTVIKENIEKKTEIAKKVRQIIDIEAGTVWRKLTKSEPELVLSR